VSNSPIILLQRHTSPTQQQPHIQRRQIGRHQTLLNVLRVEAAAQQVVNTIVVAEVAVVAATLK